MDISQSRKSDDFIAKLSVIANRKQISKNMASEFVGGRRRLERLVEDGKIRFDKPNNVQNGKWTCNLWDVLKCI